MTNKKISLFIAVTLTVLFILSVFMCIFWLPSAILYFNGIIGEENGSAALYTVCFIIAAPLFAILLMGYYFPYAVYKDTVFHKNTANMLYVIGIILFCDCSALASANVWLISKGEKLISPALIFVSAIGFTVSAVLFILSKYVKRGATLKEEADCTL